MLQPEGTAGGGNPTRRSAPDPGTGLAARCIHDGGKNLKTAESESQNLIQLYRQAVKESREKRAVICSIRDRMDKMDMLKLHKNRINILCETAK